jgi:hypothetical protein
MQVLLLQGAVAVAGHSVQRAGQMRRSDQWVGHLVLRAAVEEVEVVSVADRKPSQLPG